MEVASRPPTYIASADRNAPKLVPLAWKVRVARNLQGRIENFATLCVLYAVFFLMGICDIVLKFRDRLAEWWTVVFFKKWRIGRRKPEPEPKGLVRRFYDLEKSFGSWLCSPGSIERGDFIHELATLEVDRDRLEIACQDYAATRQEEDDARGSFWDGWDSLSLTDQYRKLTTARVTGKICGGHHVGFIRRLQEFERNGCRHKIWPITACSICGPESKNPSIIRRRDAVEATRKKMAKDG